MEIFELDEHMCESERNEKGQWYGKRLAHDILGMCTVPIHTEHRQNNQNTNQFAHINVRVRACVCVHTNVEAINRYKSVWSVLANVYVFIGISRRYIHISRTIRLMRVIFRARTHSKHRVPLWILCIDTLVRAYVFIFSFLQFRSLQTFLFHVKTCLFRSYLFSFNVFDCDCSHKQDRAIREYNTRNILEKLRTSINEQTIKCISIRHTHTHTQHAVWNGRMKRIACLMFNCCCDTTLSSMCMPAYVCVSVRWMNVGG